MYVCMYLQLGRVSAFTLLLSIYELIFFLFMTISSSSYYNYYFISSSSSSSSSRRRRLMILILILTLCTIPTTISILEVESINQALPNHAITPAPSPRAPRASSWSLPASQREALLAFKRSIESDPLGVLDQWDPDRHPDPCLWEGVQCGPPNPDTNASDTSTQDTMNNVGVGVVVVDVITLTLPRSRLLGHLAPELGQLARLRHLNLHHNRLYGPIPDRLFDGAAGLKSLFLFSNNFSGSLPPGIGRLASLQSLDLSDNSLSGNIPSSLMSGCARLAFVSLDHNVFSGPVPGPVPGSLEYLDISHNRLDGAIPESIFQGGLEVLNLSHNRLSGGIPSSLAGTGTETSIDVSYNNLSGPIPSNRAYSVDAFLGNPGLCGPPLRTLCGPQAMAGSENGGHRNGHGHGGDAWGGQEIAMAVAMGCTAGVVLMCIGCLCCCYWGNTWPRAGRGRIRGSAEEEEQQQEIDYYSHGEDHYNNKSIITTSVISHGSQKSMTMLACCSSSSSSSFSNSSNTSGSRARSGEIGGHIYKGSDRATHCFGPSRWFGCAGKPGPSVAEEEEEERYKGELVALEGGEVSFTIEELLRAAAYVLGKSCGAGIVYRVVVSEEVTVAVRRLGEGGARRNGHHRHHRHRHKEFESEVGLIASARHPNVVRLRAYSCSPDEKLLVYDFLPNGNLGSALRRHGWHHQQGLVWWARLKIARAVARAMAFIHEQRGGTAAHGDLKPNNILLDMGLDAYVADYGLGRLVSIAGSGVVPAPTRNTRVPTKDLDLHYYAPEAIDVVFKAGSGGETTLFSLGVDRFVKATQKGDVYSMGMVLLELLTGISDDQHRRQRQSPQYIMHMNQLLLHDIDPTQQEASAREKPEPLDIRGGPPRPRPANASPPPDLLLHILDPVLVREMAQHEEQMVATLHLALSCVALHPEERPTMRHVSISLDRISSTGTPLHTPNDSTLLCPP